MNDRGCALAVVLLIGLSVHPSSSRAELVPLDDRLREHGIPPTRSGVVAYLRRLLPQADHKARVSKLIQQLGADRFRDRERATRELTSMPHPPVRELKEAMHHRDVEIAYRSLSILKCVEEQRFETTAVEVLEFIQREQITGLTGLLMNVSASWSDEKMLAAVEATMRTTVSVGDLTLLRKAVKSAQPARQRLAIVGLGALPELDVAKDLVPILKDENSRVVIGAAEELANRGDARCLEPMIRFLGDENELVSARCKANLHALTGQVFEKESPESDRRAWLQWVKEQSDLRIRYPLSEANAAIRLVQAGGLVGVRFQGGTVSCRAVGALPLDRITVVEVQLKGDSANSESLTHLDRLAGLRRLSLSNGSLSDASLAPLGRQPHLRTLSLAGCGRLSSDCLIYVQPLVHLESLDLSATNVSTLAPLAHLSGLRSLNLNQCRKLNGRGLLVATQLPRLEELDIEETIVSEQEMLNLDKLRKLRVLRLGRTATDAVMERLANSEVEELTISYSQITGAGMQHIGAMHRLHLLHLYHCSRIDSASLRHIRNLRHMRDLRLVCPQVGDEALGHVTQLSELQRLDLYSTQVTGIGLLKLHRLERLKSLSIARTPLTNDAMKAVGGLTGLVELNVRVTRCNDAHLQHITNLKQLRRLNLESTRVEGAGIRYLADLPQLRELLLYNTRPNDQGLQLLAALRNVRILELGNTPVSDDSMRHVAKMEQLVELGLAQTQISDAGLKYLARLENLEHLRVRRSKISDAALAALQAKRTKFSWSR